MARLTIVALLLALLAVALVPGQDPADADEQQLRALGLPIDTAGLLEFFRSRTARAEDRRVLSELVRQLDHGDYSVRSKATQQLLARGPAALPFLQEALQGSSLEAKRRAEDCIAKIKLAASGDGPALAARLLLRRGAPGAVVALLDYLPGVDDPWLQEELLTSLGRLAVRPGQVEPALVRALEEPPAARRALAAYLLGRRGGLEQRQRLRSLLEDSDPLVRRRTAEGLVGTQAVEALRESAAADEAVLRQAGVALTDGALLELLRKRTLDENDQRRLRQLVRELGSASYADRARASQLLIEEGTPALAFLKPAEHDPDAEVVRRAQHCIEMIRRGPGPALPTAAVRLLARPAPEGAPSAAAAVRGLLAYVPFADDEAVEDAVLTSLTLLCLRETKLEPALVEALSDPLPARRGAAAYVLGHVGTRAHLTGLRRLLDDPLPQVRLRAAQGLLAAQEREAVPCLIALLGELPPAALWRAEELLYRLAGDQSPAESLASADGRARAVRAWQKWWQTSADQRDLGRLAEHEAYLGLVTVAEYDSPLGQPGGRVWEGGRDGKPRWQLRGILGAMDAQVLANGRVLVAENSVQRVAERDLQGNVTWEQRVPGNPICCQRLPNGNTFIAMYNQVLEVTREHTVVYQHTPGPQFYIFSAHKTRKGTIVAMTAQGAVLELDAKTGKQLRPSLNLGAGGNWCGIESLPNGNYLVALLSANQVREYTPDGKIVWSATYRGVFRATRLPNGHTLVASMIDRKIAELDRSGTPRWERACEGRPWCVHYR